MNTQFLPQPDDPLLTSDEAAAYLDVAKHTLSVWRSTGRYRLPFVKVGRLVRYRKSDLDAFLARRTVGVNQGASKRPGRKKTVMKLALQKWSSPLRRV